ncbi:hypothetical protein NL676_002198 [Syzygium grande]|nr:hypothetical protein NL676_002198 [Syzygium grande]
MSAVPRGNHWMYRCSYCNFDVHLECAKARPVQAVTTAPPQASSVAAAQPVYIPSGSNPRYQYQTPTVLGQSNMQRVIYNPNALNIGSSQHQAQPIMWPPARLPGLELLLWWRRPSDVWSGASPNRSVRTLFRM